MNSEIIQFAQSAATQPTLGDALMQMLPMMLFIFVIFYFVYQKPMQKEQNDHRQMINSLIKGDWVITIGGVVAEVVEIQDHVLILKSGHTKKSGKSSGTEFAIVKTSIRSRWDPSKKEESKKEESKKEESKKEETSKT